jgi:septal ring factor EnvC (AmiA/AmiB activator)
MIVMNENLEEIKNYKLDIRNLENQKCILNKKRNEIVDKQVNSNIELNQKSDMLAENESQKETLDHELEKLHKRIKEIKRFKESSINNKILVISFFVASIIVFGGLCLAVPSIFLEQLPLMIKCVTGWGLIMATSYVLLSIADRHDNHLPFRHTHKYVRSIVDDIEKQIKEKEALVIEIEKTIISLNIEIQDIVTRKNNYDQERNKIDNEVKAIDDDIKEIVGKIVSILSPDDELTDTKNIREDETTLENDGISKIKKHE